ncbi:MAG: hypothetical protein DVB31_05415 [Verrucomicrobia bacterium]|nr:MAG: hypothetical protein DVB31_05415 [Verrucomicrobiota bacterium]
MPDWLDKIAVAAANAGNAELQAALGQDQPATDARRGADVTAAKGADRKINYLIFGGLAVAALILGVIIFKRR